MQSSESNKGDSPRPRVQELTLAHSPDADDAFMFYALATRKLRTGNLRLTHTLADVETLNQKALDGAYDITAVSFHAYAYLTEQYVLLPCGASFGDQYGPLVVSREKLSGDELKGKAVAVPGQRTTAFLTLKLYQPGIEPVFMPFDQILDAVVHGEVEAGVLIHEGQLTYPDAGLKKVVDLGEWWYKETQLLLPLGGNVIRRALDERTRQQAAKLLRQSVEYALKHREQALEYALHFGRGLDATTADKFVSMYVNDWTLDFGEQGREALQTLLDQGYEKGVLPHRVMAEFVEE